MKWFVWIVRLLCVLAMPNMMIECGWKFQHKPPKTIDPMWGYRTVMSMKNQDTWDFAHQVCGRIWWKVGWAMLPLALLAWTLTMRCPYTRGMICLWCLVPILLEVVVYCVTYALVERALKRNFDKNGNRR